MEPASTNIAHSDYARKRRDIYKLVQELRSLGADTEIPIPQIAVIGGQSAGKSSLVEAVTGLSVPRDSGTCTRCPMECGILTTPGDWNCKVSLRFGSVESSRQSLFSPTLTSKEDVEIWIRRAQAAILSPQTSPERFKTMDYLELRELTSDARTLKFSENVVVVDIEDPEGTDLSFVDLPGLVQNEDQDMIDLVKDLVERYIKPESTIIIVTIPASDDMENQQAVRLARAADPSGKRTIGVVTKPDSLTAGAIGARQKWLNILQGKAHKLELGYFTVRLPDDDERARKLPREELERLAMQFFSATEPWSNLLQSGRVGIPSFVSHISKVLMRIIQESLPRLREAVAAKLAECMRQIGELPEAVTVDATTEILNRVSSFCTDLQGDVYGLNESKRFVHRSREVYKTFKHTIRSTAPDFRPFIDPSEYISPPPPNSEADKLDEDVLNDSVVESTPQPIGLLEVRRVIKESTGWELPHNVPFEAKKRLIKRFIDGWPAPAQECFDEIAAILSAVINEKISQHFGQFRALEQHIGPIIRGEVVEYSAHGRRSLVDVLECEKPPYFTQNGHYLESSRTNWLAHYTGVYGIPGRYLRHQQFDDYSRSPSPPMMSRAPSPAPHIVTSRPVDQYQDELIVMADVRAYFRVAYKRIIDNVPMTIQRHLCQELSDGLQRRLVAKLDLGSANSPQRLKELLEEDPALKAHRAQLLVKLKQLEAMQAKLENFVI